jgi:pseudaminic acid cytidylyltransferase
MRIAIIPARGGSKRIERKNVRLFAGRPMIEVAIAAAQASGLFDRLLVSTDDDEIMAVATAAGAEAPFRRPAELSGDHVATVPVIAHAIQETARLGWPAADPVCCLYPCTPFLRTEDLVASLDLIEAGADYAFPVAPFPSPPQRALAREADGRVRPLDARYAATRTQDLEPAYHDAGQFYWGRRQAWLDGLNIHEHGRAIVIPAWRAVDIDTFEDWERAERLHRLGDHG